MWEASTWKSEDDLYEDLILLAEYSVPTSNSAIQVPETILKYRKQMAANQQKPLNSDIDENASIVVSGRGRGIRDRLIRPGGLVESHPSDEVELKKQIRQVSGLGYSNELIEQSIKSKSYKPNSLDDIDSSFKLVPTSDSSSSRSSSESTPTRKKIHLTNDSSTDSVTLSK